MNLDSEDLSLRFKGHASQRGAVHEFGHMLGLEDEYLAKSPHRKDYKSVMNQGEQVLHRHDSKLLSWLNKELERKGIQ